MKKALVSFLETGTAGHFSQVPEHNHPQHETQPGETGGLCAVQGRDLVGVMESSCYSTDNRLLRSDGLDW